MKKKLTAVLIVGILLGFFGGGEFETSDPKTFEEYFEGNEDLGQEIFYDGYDDGYDAGEQDGWCDGFDAGWEGCYDYYTNEDIVIEEIV